MQKLLQPEPTLPWEVLTYPSTWVAPVAAWTAGDTGQAITYLCLAPRGRLVALSFYRTARNNNLQEFHLLPEGLTPQEAAATTLARISKWAQDEGLGETQSAPHEATQGRARSDLNSIWFAKAWDAWVARNKDVKLLSCVYPKGAAQLAARLLAAEMPAISSSGIGNSLSNAFFSGAIPVDEPESIPLMVHMLGLLCEQYPDGPLDAVRLIRKEAGSRYHGMATDWLSKHLTAYRTGHEGRALGSILWRLFKELPPGFMESRQALLDEFFQSNPSEETLRRRCKDKEPFLGPLPVRFSLVQVLCELISAETLEGFMLWATDKLSVAA